MRKLYMAGCCKQYNVLRREWIVISSCISLLSPRSPCFWRADHCQLGDRWDTLLEQKLGQGCSFCDLATSEPWSYHSRSLKFALSMVRPSFFYRMMVREVQKLHGMKHLGIRSVSCRPVSYLKTGEKGAWKTRDADISLCLGSRSGEQTWTF